MKACCDICSQGHTISNCPIVMAAKHASQQQRPVSVQDKQQAPKRKTPDKSFMEYRRAPAKTSASTSQNFSLKTKLKKKPTSSGIILDSGAQENIINDINLLDDKEYNPCERQII